LTGKLLKTRKGLLLAVIAGVAIAVAGCAKPQSISLRYMPDPAVQATTKFFPAKVAVAAARWDSRNGAVGHVFDASGSKVANLRIGDPGLQIAQVIAQAFQAAGLQPVVIGSVAEGGKPPLGIDFLAITEIAELTCEKNFQSTPTAKAFRLNTRVGLKITILGPGRTPFTGEGVSVIDEPPPGVDLATYKPAIAEPSDAVSIALSRAVRSVLDQPAIAHALPHRTAVPFERSRH
jgi:hypothetical protein